MSSYVRAQNVVLQQGKTTDRRYWHSAHLDFSAILGHVIGASILQTKRAHFLPTLKESPRSVCASPGRRTVLDSRIRTEWSVPHEMSSYLLVHALVASPAETSQRSRNEIANEPLSFVLTVSRPGWANSCRTCKCGCWPRNRDRWAILALALAKRAGSGRGAVHQSLGRGLFLT
jgi:hypothetical protein